MSEAAGLNSWPLLPCTAAVVVFAKAPVASHVKTRLCPPLTPAAAAELQRACLCDFWERLARLSPVRRILCHDPPECGDQFRQLLGEATELLPQAEGDLGDRLAAALRALFARGLGPVVAVGADSPDLPLRFVADALRLLTTGRSDVVVGPALDGGYTLIGLSRFHPDPFLCIPWSTSDVCAMTRDRCAEAGLRLVTLAPWEDVDDAGSLARLRDRVLSHPDGFPCLSGFFAEHPFDPAITIPANGSATPDLFQLDP
jgi:rSAM/selenodomain-associated transferase 1